MKVRGHGNAVSIALAGLAVVIAATGTAVAVTTNNVRIADGKTASELAVVDSTGKLSVGGYQSTLDTTSIGTGTQTDAFVTSPTNAVLAITHLSLTTSGNPAVYSVRLLQVPVTDQGGCSTTTVDRSLYRTILASTDRVVEDYANPIVVRPMGSAKYCLDIFLVSATSGSVNLNVTGFVVYGSYSGIGTASVKAARVPGKKTSR